MRFEAIIDPPLVRHGRTWAIIWPFIAIVVILVSLAYLSMDVLAGVRAYVTGESAWSKAQKEAVYDLLRYSETHAEADFERFRRAIEVTRWDQRARMEMDKSAPDYALVREGMLRGQVHPDDVSATISLYRRFKYLSFMEHVIRIWVEGDRHIDQLDLAGAQLHRAITTDGAAARPMYAALDSIYAVDAELTPMEHRFSATLGEAARMVEFLLILSTLLIAATLVPLGVLLSRRMVHKSFVFEQALRISEERFQLAVSGSNDGIWDWNTVTGEFYVSPRFKELLGFRDEEFSASLAAVLARLHPEDAHATRRAIARQSRESRLFEAEFPLRMRSGVYRWFRIRGQSIRNGARRPIRMVGSMSDITEYRLATDQLFAEKERLQVTLEAIGDAVVTADTAGRVQYLNPAAEQLTGWREADAAGRALGEVCVVIDEASHLPLLHDTESALRNHRVGTPARNTLLVQRSGSALPVSAITAPIHDERKQVRGIVVALRDVSQERRHAADLSYQASHDALTGLINRREFDLRLARALQGAREEGREHAVLYLDLDQFKVVNDTCGHAAGDELIRQVSTLLPQRLRIGDTLARLGGDEFGVLLENCGAEHAERIAEQLRETMIGFRFAWQGQPFTLGVSIGLVNVHDTAMTPAAVLSTADAACYLAKDKGRNRVQTYHPDDRELLTRRGEMEWVARIREALEQDRFVLYAQPIAPLRGASESAETGGHFEVLVRMQDPNGPVVPPMAFIPAAERFGLMAEIDRWVIRTAFATIAGRRRQGGAAAIALCAINVSGTSLGEARFRDFVLEQFERFDVPFACICFEVTETAAIANLSGAIHFMSELQALGCRFALDDFGSGMSSFAYLKHLPVEYLKIDGAFVKDMLEDPMDRSMVEAINHVGHVMGKKTIAEFAENAAIIAALRELGVDFAQGYGVGEPVPWSLER